MAWVKLDDQFPLNPKTRARSVEARYLFVTSLCWCAMQLNDGTFPANDVQVVVALADVPSSVVEQLYPNLWHREGFDCEACAEAGQVMPVPSGHVTVHCFLERNESRAQAEERRRKDRLRKRSGSESGRNPPDSRTDSTRIVPSRPRDISGQSSTDPSPDAAATRPDDDELSTTPEATWQHYAELMLTRQPNGSVKQPAPWKRSTAQNARTEHADTAARWHADYDITPHHLAQCLIDGKAPAEHYRRREPA